LIFHFDLQVLKATKCLVRGLDDTGQLIGSQTMVVIPGTVELATDDLLVTKGSSAVDELFGHLSDFSKVEVRGHPLPIRKSKGQVVHAHKQFLEL